MADTHRFSVSVAGAVIRDDGCALAIKRSDNGHWELPGGLLEPGETFVQACVREVREETGYAVKPLALTGVYQNVAHDIVAIVFRCMVTDGAARLSPESEAVEWLAPEDVCQLMNEAYAVRILDAMSGSQAAVTRVHDGVSVL